MKKSSLFYEEISELYHAVKLLRSAEIEREQKKRKKDLKLSRNVHVALTSNQHFYGTLNFEIINKFYENTKNTKGEKIIVGKTGKEYLEAISGIGSFISIIYEKDLPKDAEIKEFIEKIKIYDRVYIYYPKFMSIVSQKVDVVDITYSPPEGFSSQKEIGYIFEPELSKIVDFFETQVKYLLFARVLLETELSKTAARLMAMNRAEEKADDLISDYRIRLTQAYKSLINARLVETFSGIRKWRRT